jgi:hypothetical protein
MVVTCASETTRSYTTTLRWGYEGKLRAPSRWVPAHVTASRISKVVPRSAVDGQLMGVHDGMTDQWGGIYYWIGMG